MIVIPQALDQPAVAIRLEWLGVAEVLPIENISAQRLRLALSKVIENPSYRSAARDVQGKILSLQGLERAADIIEGAVESYAQRGRRRTL